MRATAQSLELDASFVEIRRLIEPKVAADQDLIGTDHERAIVTRSHASCLGLGKTQRTAGRVTAFFAESSLQRALINPSRLDPNLKTGGFKHSGSRHARRGEYQTASHPHCDAAPAIS
jgi:hypothetical protein